CALPSAWPRGNRSSTTQLRPASTIERAAAEPAAPAPTTATSKRSIARVCQAVLEMPPPGGETARMADRDPPPLRLPPMSHYAPATLTIAAVLAILRAAFESRKL